MRRAVILGALVLVGVVAGSLSPTVTYGGSIAVTRTDDPPPNGCLPTDCSLREAIIAANSDIGPDTIRLLADHYTLSIDGADQTALAGDLDITSNLTIEGEDDALTTIDANGISAAFDIPTANFPEPAPVTVLLRELTVTGSVGGAGIVSYAASLTLDGVTVRDNENDNDGGGITSNSGLVTVRNSTIRDNIAELTGGGLDVRSLVIENSTVSGNTSGEGGGGIATQGVTMTNTTIANNTAGGTFGGGGIVVGSFVTLIEESTITNSTITDNQSTEEGGGVFATDDANLVIQNTIFWNNSAPQGPDCRGTISGEVNIIESESGCSLAGDSTSGDPLLFPLGDYGGPVLTRGIPLESPARDAGDDTACPETDARGIPRPQHNQSDSCDIGAFEYLYVGDIDCSGTVELPDLLASLREIARLEDPLCLYRGDLNCDRVLNGLDALFIARHKSPVAEQPRPEYCPVIGPDAGT